MSYFLPSKFDFIEAIFLACLTEVNVVSMRNVSKAPINDNLTTSVCTLRILLTTCERHRNCGVCRFNQLPPHQEPKQETLCAQATKIFIKVHIILGTDSRRKKQVMKLVLHIFTTFICLPFFPHFFLAEEDNKSYKKLALTLCVFLTFT